jgi:hypothetical protein
VAAADRDADRGGEGPEAQLRDVQHAADLGVVRVEELEPAVAPEPVDVLGADAAADAVRRLDHEHVQPGGPQPARAGQPGHAGAHDDDLGTARDVGHGSSWARRGLLRR